MYYLYDNISCFYGTGRIQDDSSTTILVTMLYCGGYVGV